MKIKFLFLFAICGSQAKIGKYIKEYPKLSIKFAVDILINLDWKLNWKCYDNKLLNTFHGIFLEGKEYLKYEEEGSGFTFSIEETKPNPTTSSMPVTLSITLLINKKKIISNLL